MNDSSALLRLYAEGRNEAAFRQIVARYFDFVHGVASRRLGPNSAHALDVVQIVFTNLARQAATLRDDCQLGGWLHSHTCFVAAKLLRSETRRTAREQHAAQMNSLENSSEDLWPAVAPVIDEALQDLDEPDRAVILLRYFEGRDLRAVGKVFSVSEDAAQKRVHRALERLRTALEGRGVAVAVTALAAILLANASPAFASAPIVSITSRALGEHASIPALKAALFILIPALLCGYLVWPKKASSVVNASKTRPPAAALADTATPLPEPTATAPATNPTAFAGPHLLLHVVSAATGAGIRGANIYVSTSDKPNSLTPPFEPGDFILLADAKGDARIPIPEPPPKRLMLRASADAHGDWISIWEKAAGEEIPQEFTVTLDPGVVVGGRVIDSAGNGIQGAEIRLGNSSRNGITIDRSHQHPANHSVTNVTDASGAWFANHMTAKFIDNISVRVAHPDYMVTHILPNARDFTELRERTWTVTIQKGLDLAGRITNQKGEPISGAQVGFGLPFYTGAKQTVTDTEGRYQLRGLPTGPALSHESLSVRAAGYAPVSRMLTAEPITRELNIALSEPVTLRGRVFDSAGKPMKGVRAQREGNGVSWMGHSDDEGRFVWTEAPNEPQSFYFYAPGYLQIRRRALNPGDAENVITMQNDIRLKGTVRDSQTDKPVPEFPITQGKGSPERLSGSSDYDRQFKNGAFDIALGESDYNLLRVTAAGYFGITVEIPPDYQFDIKLKPAGALEGIVLDGDGKPFADAEVVAIDKDRMRNPSLMSGHFTPQPVGDRARTDDAGHFKLTLSGKPIAIVAAHPDSGFATATINQFQTSPQLRLAGWGRVEGIVLLEGAPSPGQDVYLDTLGSPVRLETYTYKTPSDDAGHFAFDHLPPTQQLMLAHPVALGTNRLAESTNFLLSPGATKQIQFNSTPPQRPTNHGNVSR